MILKTISMLVAVIWLSSCSAPLSFKLSDHREPSGTYVQPPLSDAIAEYEAGLESTDPLIASGRFFESARLAKDKALAGEPGALDLYNLSVGQLVLNLEEADSLPWGRTLVLKDANGRDLTLKGRLEEGAPALHREYIDASTLEFKGRYAQIGATRGGVGAPLVAVSDNNPEFRKTFSEPAVHKAVTAVLNFSGRDSATLELHDPLDTEKISIAGRRPLLAADFTAPISMYVATARPDKLGFTRLLNPEKYSATARLTRLQEYDKDRIPVLFVHGLDSTPVTWTFMYNTLMQDPEIRRRYQFWVFSYPSGYPYFHSAALLREELAGVKSVFPDQKEMIIIGHSMGGLLSRLMVTDAGDRIWKGFFGTSPANTKIAGSSRRTLEDALVFDNVKNIRTAIFIATPHQGSQLSNIWLGRLFSRLVRLPTSITDARNAVASVLTADAASLQLDRAPNSIDTLSPDNRFVREVNKIPIAPGVTYHTIVGDRGKGDTPNSGDGVVPYWSSHLDGAASEKIVPSGHGAHEHPEGIREVRRILEEYARSTR